MKKSLSIPIFLLSLFLLSGCIGERNSSDTLSEQDILAVEKMAEAYDYAETYNDSLEWCIDVFEMCSENYMHNCDSVFHHFMDEFEHYHHEYSHNNVVDDHYHEAMSSHMNGNHGHGTNEDAHHHHLFEQHYEMDDLLHQHQAYHIGD